MTVNDIGHSTLPWQWLLRTISQQNHSFHLVFQTDHCRLVSTFCRSGMEPRARITDTQLSFDVTLICSTLTRCGASQMQPFEVNYVYQRVWRWKWFSHTPRPIRTIGSVWDGKNISHDLADFLHNFCQHLKKCFSIMTQKHRRKHMVIVDATV